MCSTAYPRHRSVATFEKPIRPRDWLPPRELRATAAWVLSNTNFILRTLKRYIDVVTIDMLHTVLLRTRHNINMPSPQKSSKHRHMTMLCGLVSDLVICQGPERHVPGDRHVRPQRQGCDLARVLPPGQRGRPIYQGYARYRHFTDHTSQQRSRRMV